jgi:hypothetical protein
VDGSGDHLFLDGPFEGAEDMTDPFVDLIPAEAGGNHVPTYRLESGRAELPGHRLAIQSAEGADGQPDVHRLRGGPAILHVIGVSMGEIGQEHLVDCEILRPGRYVLGKSVGRRGGRPSAVLFPLRDDPVILGPAFVRPEPSAVDVSTVQPDDTLSRCLVIRERRRSGGFSVV